MPATPVELLIALFFIVPGFVTRSVVSANIKRNEQKPQEWAVEILLYGGVNFALVLVFYAVALSFHLMQSAEFTSFPPQPGAALIFALFGSIFLVITPTLLGAFFLWLLGFSVFLRNLLRVRPKDEPTAWDVFFDKRQQCWIVVTFRDGSRAGGFMGTRSAAGSIEDGQDIYLERSYNVSPDGVLSPDPVPDSGGIWIRGSEIKCLEFYLPPENE